jgi:hypothetical protein
MRNVIRRFRHVLLISLGVTLVTGHGFGQECRVTTTVCLSDDRGQVPMNIKAEQLRAEIDGVPAKVISFSEGPRPVTILLIDVSGSMHDVWSQAVAAAKQLAGNAGERVAVVVFRDEILEYASGREATNKLLDRLTAQYLRKGGTALYDALIDTGGKVKVRDTALVVISDGDDDASRYSSDQTFHAFLQNRWPPVFGLVLDYRGNHTHRERFNKIVAGTGGVAVYPRSASEVSQVASELSAEINAPFTITLQTPQSISKPTKLKLEVVAPDGKPRRDIQIAHVAEITACDPTPSASPPSQ